MTLIYQNGMFGMNEQATFPRASRSWETTSVNWLLDNLLRDFGSRNEEKNYLTIVYVSRNKLSQWRHHRDAIDNDLFIDRNKYYMLTKFREIWWNLHAIITCARFGVLKDMLLAVHEARDCLTNMKDNHTGPVRSALICTGRSLSKL